MAMASVLNTLGQPAGYDGPTWDTEAMQRDFEPIGFAAPFIVVKRRSDGVKGTLTFVHQPRVYFDFTPTP
jgi:hypothetical protein